MFISSHPPIMSDKLIPPLICCFSYSYSPQNIDTKDKASPALSFFVCAAKRLGTGA